MKRYLYLLNRTCLLLIVAPALLLSSCSKRVLDEVPLDFLAPENAYNTLPGIKQGIAGLYTSVRQNWYYGVNDHATQLYGMGTDLAYYGEDPGSARFLTDYSTFINPSNSYIADFWNVNFQMIQRVNSLIKGINEADAGIWADESQKNAYLGEARFFRAFAYRLLVSYYGDVPLVDDVITTAKTDFVRTPKAEIYKFMEDDLAFAAGSLPVQGKEEATGRITQGAAWSILSEVYLSDGQYQLAVDAASKVIDGYHYSLMKNRFGTKLGHDIFGSGDPYYDLFGYGNQNLTENNEAIWVIQVEPLIVGGLYNQGERVFGPAYFRMGNTPDGFPAFRGELVDGNYTGYSDTLGRPVGWMRPTNYLAYDIWKGDWNKDMRNAEHNIKRNFYFDSPGSIYDKKKIDFSLYPAGSRNALNDTCQYIYPYFIKAADPLHHLTNAIESGGGDNHKDIYAIRLSETLLLRAEAYVRLENPGAAADDINEIRNRAKATPVKPAEVNLDYILDERARELYCEEWRPLTLRRMGKLVERVKKYNNNPMFPGANIQDFNILYPIPQNQIDLNIGAVMEQNNGY
ncbi:RagB/SusD family nutrient uptake outer membrane protein [Chitinophaga sp. MM2321]|uniref:RagB/SusD family nutrient uptake outer membrane protein n=1 Tax=Chitinophaga sp. MM2321 TaxID=3137178 RepID=UPI0032D586AF